ncbi:hypothetical protein AX774_g744 [Zancudomyces culisetae]|uniref:Uncharacterized protein n=1 Tax=Zancudomyces culisetae TaxID=1213189 RepID=A0A1R1PXM4_ZANCU|nr:hypothetical protein AX774_g1564 [Zancudomyces culisetae]OMH85714.1 hypothetical protein AX774_g744 [Zancudomyces culisetae]|eukprot:OMH84909.1 hypothetical protein AX774_g1564 [Zancudomyces culisetae]
MFSIFKSLCTIEFLCKYANPDPICLPNFRASVSFKCPFCIIYSNICPPTTNSETNCEIATSLCILKSTPSLASLSRVVILSLTCTLRTVRGILVDSLNNSKIRRFLLSIWYPIRFPRLPLSVPNLISPLLFPLYFSSFSLSCSSSSTLLPYLYISDLSPFLSISLAIVPKSGNSLLTPSTCLGTIFIAVHWLLRVSNPNLTRPIPPVPIVCISLYGPTVLPSLLFLLFFPLSFSFFDTFLFFSSCCFKFLSRTTIAAFLISCAMAFLYFSSLVISASAYSLYFLISASIISLFLYFLLLVVFRLSLV